MIKHLIDFIKYDIVNFETIDELYSYRLDIFHIITVEDMLKYKRKHTYINIWQDGYGLGKRYYTVVINKHSFRINNGLFKKWVDLL